MKGVIKKLRFKSDCAVINAPADLKREFVSLGCSTALDPEVKSRNTLIFIRNFNDFEDFLKFRIKEIESDGNLWLAYPKQSSGIKTDINRDILRINAGPYGITTVAAISINDTWSALRFRPIDKMGK